MAGVSAPPVVAAGLVANQPQPAPDAPAPPPAADVAPAGGGGQIAHLKKGANIRNGGSNKKTKVLQSPAALLAVLGCDGWCRIAMPQYLLIGVPHPTRLQENQDAAARRYRPSDCLPARAPALPRCG